ncbi:MAG TPA: hypothetical protein VHM92_08700 [Allosphingosinicella sp.]|nr:hypothetical protein [Allosphingosinicella sp.]
MSAVLIADEFLVVDEQRGATALGARRAFRQSVLAVGGVCANWKPQLDRCPRLGALSISIPPPSWAAKPCTMEAFPLPHPLS